MRANAKVAAITRDTDELIGMLKTFQAKHEAEGRTVFTHTLEFYLNALRFEPKKINLGLDEELRVVQRELDLANTTRLETIKNA